MSAIVIFDIDGVIRDVTNSYRRALADTVEHFTSYAFRPNMQDIDNLKSEGIWNNDWEGSQELIYRFFESQGQDRSTVDLDYEEIVDFFQRRYRGSDLENPEKWDGYITKEPLLVDRDYFDKLTANNLTWGFFSGATKGSANFILNKRLGLETPVLVAMEDAPGKPNPTGLFDAIKQLEQKYDLPENLPVVYLGDTVADMTTIVKAREVDSEREFIAIGVLPPHINYNEQVINQYRQQLFQAGASNVVDNTIDFQNI